MKYLSLSHILTSQTPSYANNGKLEILRTRSIKAGDTSNETELAFNNHMGTHIDAPFHFSELGKKLDDYTPDMWFCNFPYMIEYNAEPGEVLSLGKLKPLLEDIPESTDILMLRTNFEKYRNSNLNFYCFQNPAIEPSVGLWLRKNRRLKFFGFDYISLSSRAHREMGRESHRAFLCDSLNENMIEGDPILLIEDMKLSEIKNSLRCIIVSPLFFESADGAPATVLAEIKS